MRRAAGKIFLERTNLILEEVEKAAADARHTGAGVSMRRQKPTFAFKQ
ncbi:hypothetical protein [Cupriavidus sp. DL-D2]